MKSNIPPKGCIPRSACKSQQSGQRRRPIRAVLPYICAPRTEHTKALESLLAEAQVQERELLEFIKINPLDEKLKELDRIQYFIRQLNVQISARSSK